MCGIYKITNNINGKCYIGLSTNIERRWQKHKTSPFNPKAIDYDCLLYKAIRKYGLESFSFEVLMECKSDELSKMEVQFITMYDANNKRYGYNQNNGGYDAKNPLKLTTETANQIIDILKTSDKTNAQIANAFGVSEGMIRNINYGKCWFVDGINYPIRQVRKRSPNGTHCKRNYKTKQCACCGELIYAYANHCVKCANQLKSQSMRKVQCRPNAIELARLIIESNFVQVGKMFGVCDKTIRKWLQHAGAPLNKQQLIMWYKEQVIE